MKSAGHLVISTVIADGSYLTTNSPVIALSSLGIGVLIDGDHLFDYGCYLIYKKGKQLPNPTQFLSCSYMEEIRKTFLPFHSYELLLVILAICLTLFSVPLAIWSAISFSVHLLTDQISHRPHPLCYFLTFRIMKRFDMDVLCGRTKENVQ